MLIELILSPFFGLIDLVITLLPNIPSVNVTLSNLVIFVRKGLYFTDTGVFSLVLGTVITFSTLQLGWAVIEWIYKKIPGVD